MPDTGTYEINYSRSTLGQKRKMLQASHEILHSDGVRAVRSRLHGYWLLTLQNGSYLFERRLGDGKVVETFILPVSSVYSVSSEYYDEVAA
ncbi:hypothetical protein CN140_01645 [Sinorhizobium meliloti]|uniref:hypothetical protein n=1 Tax=Rhizobium meliloti TaxID=382 RepID=UPI000FD93DBF|nr:hypothetical protein [Sinorhizobium meliloti]RVL87660.1 hypothetical protein CN140_01645 [Sinorhizobium meliloti]